MGNNTSSGSTSTEASKKRVVVIGTGVGGSCMARIADAAGFQVTAIERRVGAVWKPGGPRAIVDPEWAMTKGLVPLRGIVKGKKSSRIQDDAVQLDAERKIVVLAGGAQVEYDYCVLAVGSQNASPCDPPPQCTTVEGIRAHYDAVNAAIRKATRIVVVGGGAVGIEVAGQVRETVAKGTHVTVVHSGAKLLDVSLPGADPTQMTAFQDRIARKCAEASIELVLGARCTNLSQADCPGGFKEAKDPFPVTLSTGTVLQADLVLWCVGARSNAPHLVPAAALDLQSQLIRVDASLRVIGLPDVFAIGDCTNVPEPKLSVSAGSNVGKTGLPSGHADVVLANLLDRAKGRDPTHVWGGLKSVASIIPVTKAVGGAGLGAPNFLATLKTTKLQYFASSGWAGAGAGKFGKAPVSKEDEIAPSAAVVASGQKEAGAPPHAGDE